MSCAVLFALCARPNVDSKLNVSKCAFHATFHKVYSQWSERRVREISSHTNKCHRHKYLIFTLFMMQLWLRDLILIFKWKQRFFPSPPDCVFCNWNVHSLCSAGTSLKQANAQIHRFIFFNAMPISILPHTLNSTIMLQIRLFVCKSQEVFCINPSRPPEPEPED